MRVLIAFDKFKDALTAPEACSLATATLQEVRPDWHADPCPLADGGEGFATILTAAAGGSWHPVEATGPRGKIAPAGFGLVDTAKLSAAAHARLDLGAARSLAVIEMASASGLQSLAPADRDPWQTDTRGTGQLIRAAIDAGAEALLLGVGGSATHDVGIGALTALGWQALRADGSPIERVCPAGWGELAQLVPSLLTLPPIRIACDVANPLLGERGAATVFGPQKGLQPADLPRLEAETARVATLLGTAAGRPGLESTPGAGAAGGIAYGLLTAANAQLVPGFDLVEDWLELSQRISAAELVITGEGRFDESSLEGKGPGALARRALDEGKQVWVLAGAVDVPSPPVGITLAAVTPPGTPLAEALPATATNLARTLRQQLAPAPTD
ncbi:glycerate kinase [Actomonas aquatica]|uniref:Glycerate kinase n=1 Tax=Actomonas aquatica TaxID=2866162 RepID=A0ABZ1C695_9BACT|nr:glycerate kinase [Opitutus sp. WL0086]WRQ87036.1 glycerate kinase [Opitutus sp. WL0086]